MKRFLSFLTQVSVSAKRSFLMTILLLAFVNVSGQNAIVGTGFSSGWGDVACPTSNGNFKYLGDVISGTYGVTTTANATGDQYFRFGVDWSGTTAQYTMVPGSDTDVTPNTVYSLNTTCTTSGAMRYNVPSISYNYVFKTLKAGTNPTGTFIFFEIEGDVRNVTNVSQLPLAANVRLCSATTVTATLDGALSAGQLVYMRYTKDNYASSTVVPLTGSGITYTGTIPSTFNVPGDNVSYYVFTSGTTTPSGADADLYTINLNNNGGSNYSYTVSSAATTSIPDANFEQALVDLGFDCVVDGKVVTSDISGVTSLTLRDKHIADLTGIKDFTSLTFLLCRNEDGDLGNDNEISNLDLSGMTTLNYLYCDGIGIVNLNLSGMTNLWELVVSNNPLASPTLDLRQSPDLYYLFCESNNLTAVDITGLTKLTVFGMLGNSIATLDVSNNPDLYYLDCDDNSFTSLDVSGLTSLTDFYCNGNQLTSLDVRGLVNLDYFECSSNISLSCILVDNVDAAEASNVLGDWAKDATATYSHCACDLTTTWTSASGGSWDNEAPTTGTYAAIIAYDYSEAADINACSLTINNNAVVMIPSVTNVTLNAPLTVETGSSFTLSNNANLVQTNDYSVNSGDINVMRNSSPLFRLDYTLWSSPVMGTQTLGNFSPLTASNRFYTYISIADVYSAKDPTDTFSVPNSYLIRTPNNWVDYVAALPSTPASWTGTFTGTPNNGAIFRYMFSGQYVAVGNPYPSTLSIDQFLAANSGRIDGTMWFWRKRNDVLNLTSYSTCTTAGCALNNGHVYPNTDYISVGQGFIVKATATDALVFDNSMRVSNTTNQFFKTKKMEKDRMWLNLSMGSNPVNQMLVAYMDGATTGIDQAIDGAYFGDGKIALNSLIGNKEFAVQGRSLPFDGTDVVPLAFKTDIAGDFSIALDHTDGLFSGSQDIYLLDALNGTETNLKSGSYNFSATAGVDNARFSLKYQKTLKVGAPSFDDNTVAIFKNKGVVSVNSKQMAIDNVKVYDIQGRIIAEQKNVKANTASVNISKVAPQVLIVKVTGENNKVVSKKIAN